MSTETDCRCNFCGTTWFYNDQDIRSNMDKINSTKAHVAVGIVGALSKAPTNAMYQTNVAQNEVNSVVDYTRCPNCGSHDVAYATYDIYNYFLDDPRSPMYSTVKAIPEASDPDTPRKNKLVAAALAIFLGGVGAHKFYLGYTKEALIMLLVSLIGGGLTAGIATIVIMIIGLIEGIMYLLKDPDDFNEIYVFNHKGWF